MVAGARTDYTPVEVEGVDIGVISPWSGQRIGHKIHSADGRKEFPIHKCPQTPLSVAIDGHGPRDSIDYLPATFLWGG